MAANTALKMAIWDSPFTQTVIAKKTGINESRLSRIIHGHVDAEPEEQKSLARLLKVPVSQIFTEVAA